MATVNDLVRTLQDWFPLHLAAEWDNVGLLLGDAAGPVERVMTCLTVTPESAAEAIRERAELIVSHHPVLFRPIQKLTGASGEGRMLLDLARAGIAIYSPHTAFDNARGGINDFLAERLGLSQVKPLRALNAEANVKLVVFVPDNDLTKVSEAIWEAGAGRIGSYRECSFRLAGTGTFHGDDASNPTIGQKGRREECQEWRLEVVCPKGKLENVVRALRRAHSYEEPAFDLYPLAGDPSRFGQGRIGRLDQRLTLADFTRRVESCLGAVAPQVVGDATVMIETVALACGAAGEFAGDAARAGADVFVTGELRFHDALTAQSKSLAVVVAGHFATERPAVEELAQRIAAAFPSLTTWPSRDERDPLHLV